MKVVAVSILSVLLLAACSVTDEGTSEAVESTSGVPSEAVVTTVVTVRSETGEDSEVPTMVPEPEGPAFVPGLDIGVILLLNPVRGGGGLPELIWESSDGVSRHDVFVFDGEGDLYWSWSTPETSIYLGGVETDNPNAPGPRIFESMTWIVLGFDSSGALIAQSEVRPISP